MRPDLEAAERLLNSGLPVRTHLRGQAHDRRGEHTKIVRVPITGRAKKVPRPSWHVGHSNAKPVRRWKKRPRGREISLR